MSDRCELCGDEASVVLDNIPLCNECKVLVMINVEDVGKSVKETVLRAKAKARNWSMFDLLVDRIPKP